MTLLHDDGTANACLQPIERDATAASNDGQCAQAASPPWCEFVFDSSATVPPEKLIYEGLLAKGDLAIWLGREKHRKSNVLLQFAICAAVGRDFLHFPFCPGQPLKVVVLDYESKTHSLHLRYQSIVSAMELSETEQSILKSNLQIVEMRKAFRHGLKFARFPVRLEKRHAGEFKQAEEEWRSFVRNTAADLYVIDPMRCMHAQAENDSAIETLLTRVHEVFGDAAVVISHHLRKRDQRGKYKPTLEGDMRAWADEARGSGAITAHADVIVCQERVVEGEMEMLYLGAYLRDGADVEPMPLHESAVETFFWKVAPGVPVNLIQCMNALQSEEEYSNRTAAVAVLETRLNLKRSTAYSRVSDLVNRGLLRKVGGVLRVCTTVDKCH